MNCFIKKCPICGEELLVDDIDYNFEGNQDEYSFCPHCKLHYIFYIRYGNLWKYQKTKSYYDEKLRAYLVYEDDKYSETIYVYKGGKH